MIARRAAARELVENNCKPRTLFLLNGLGVGGSERKTVAVVNKLHRSGWKVHVAYLDPRTAILDSIEEGVPVVFLDRKNKVSIPAVKKLRAHIIENEIQKVVCINLFPLLYANMAVTLLWSGRRPELFLFENTMVFTGRKAHFHMLLFRPLMNRAKRIVFGCDTQRNLWIDRYRVDHRKCDVIYNGVDESRFAPDSADIRSDIPDYCKSFNDTDVVIGAVGTLWPNKNHIELITLLERIRDTVPNAKLLIVGEGSERDRLLRAAESGGVADRVVLAGQIGDVRSALKIMDMFVLPSISENFSNAALEAMSMEKPVILSDTGGVSEMVRSGIDGYLYQQGDMETLGSLVRHLALNPAIRRTMGRKARQSVLERFTLDRMVHEYCYLLE